MSAPAIDWTDEVREWMFKTWQGGTPPLELARTLSTQFGKPVTADMVKGQLRRVRERPDGTRAPAPGLAAAGQRRPARGRHLVARALPAPDTGAAVDFDTMVTGHTCRWEVTGAQEAGAFRFCPAARAPGKPYCAFHSARARSAYQPGEDKA